MIIQDLHKETSGGRVRVSASIRWEECDRSPEELWFETEEPFADALTCDPHAFLVGCSIPALYFGERRIRLDEKVCPELLVGLDAAMGFVRHWYYPKQTRPVRIEASTRDHEPEPRQERAGFFFSGGIDAFATLIRNRSNFPDGHPGAIRDGLLVYGLEMDRPEAFLPVRESLEKAAERAGIGLIPVYSNVYLKYRDEDAKNHFSFWIDQFQGAAFASIAHAFSRRFSNVSIASSDDIPHLIPAGTHPLLDPYYSSSELRIRYDSVEKSRLEKTRLVASADYALDHLRVCNQYRRYGPATLNCGRCEKCIRTMLGLLAVGALHKTDAFPAKDVTADQVLAIRHLSDEMVEASYEDLVPLLSVRGRLDLVRAIRKLLARQQARRWQSRFGWTRARSRLRRIRRLISS